MSVNKYKPHIQILPEDDANRQLANGFVLEMTTRQIQVLPEAGGWLQVCSVFGSEHVQAMRKFDKRFLVLLIDFDDDLPRLPAVLETIPQDLTNRVFVLGVRTEPEQLKAQLGSYETIGRRLAKECLDDSGDTWAHVLLSHNQEQLEQLRLKVCESLI